MAKTAKPSSELAIVNRAFEANNGTEISNLEKFYRGLIVKLNDDIEDYQAQLKIDETNFARKERSLMKRLEDLQIEVDSSFLSVTVDNIKTNADRDAEATAFWNRVKAAKRKYVQAEDELISLREGYAKTKESREEAIEQLQEYLETISK